MVLNQFIQSFNGGEVTPYLAHLTGVDKHASSVARMENFLPMPFGGFRKRPGTLDLAYLPRRSRIETFTMSDGKSYVMAFVPTVPAVPPVLDEEGAMVEEGVPEAPGEVRIHRPDGSPVCTLVKGAEVPADFLDPFRLQFSQLNDVIEIVDPGHAPRQLRSTSDTAWELKVTGFRYPPLRDENADETHTMTVAAVDPADANGTPGAVMEGKMVTVASSRPFFEAGHVGAYFEITRKRAAVDFERSLTALHAQYTPPLEVGDTAYFSTAYNASGSWQGTFSVQRYKGGNIATLSSWEDYRNYSARHDRHVPLTEVTTDGPCLLRLRFYDEVAGGSFGNCRGILAADGAFVRGIVQITGVTLAPGETRGTVATARAVTRVPEGVTHYWAEGAFSGKRGFPRALAVHDRRRVYAGTAADPMGVWFSRTDALDDFRTGTEDDAAMFRTLAATRQAPVMWLASQRRLFVGTNTGEWVIGAESSDSALSPVNFMAREYTRFGSNTVPAITVNDSVYFVERQGLRLRELGYILERETFDAANLTRLAEHISTTGIVQMAFQQSREPFLWSVTAGGTLLSFAYHRDEKLAAWARHTTQDGAFRSVAVLRQNDEDDDVFFCVERRDEAGVTHHRLEKFSPSQQARQENGGLAEIHHVDCGFTIRAEGVERVTVGGTLPEAWRLAMFPHPGGGWRSHGTPPAGYWTRLAAAPRPEGGQDYEFTVWHGAAEVAGWQGAGMDIPSVADWVRMPDFGPGPGEDEGGMAPVLGHEDGLLHVAGVGDHLEGAVLHTLEDGVFRARYAHNGAIDLGSGCHHLRGGLPVTATITSLPQDIHTETGGTHSRMKRSHELKLNVYKSFGGSYTYDGETREIHYTRTDDNLDAAPEMRTGWIEHTLPPAHLKDLVFSIVHTEPYPFLCRGAVLGWTLVEE